MKSKRILYLGLDPSRFRHDGALTHCPLIHICPYPFNGKIKRKFKKLEESTHVLFTSRTAIPIYREYAIKVVSQRELDEKIYLCVGQATFQQLKATEINPRQLFIAQKETAEGIVLLLQNLNLNNKKIFFPRSAQGRLLIPHYLKEKKIHATIVDIYNTLPNLIALPDLNQFDEIIFTSPSTVHAFFCQLSTKPVFEKCIALGPTTKQVLNEYWNSH